MKKIKILIIHFVLCIAICANAQNPVRSMLERIDKGASKKFVIELVDAKKQGVTDGKDFFELDQKGDKVVVRGNNYVSIASGINWYLKYYAGVHLSWNMMHAKLPDVLPAVTKKERHETDLTLRYDFNYCTFSYSMAFWDWNRWEEEIDWMALHGINMPLAAVGHECVWRNMMLRMGYTEEEIGRFIAGPAFLAWWEMNNLEGWGGPLPLNWYKQQEALQKNILRRMREFGMKPVLPGYSGMKPSFAQGNEECRRNEECRMKNEESKFAKGNHSSLEKSGECADSSFFILHSSLKNSEPADSSFFILHSSFKTAESSISTIQLWNGFTRPGVIMPDDKQFDEYAKLFYEETRKLYGTAEYYSIDPFHEASNLPKDMNIGEAGKKILNTMKDYGNEHSTWVVQGWSENPRPEMLDALPNGDVLVLDLFSECRPQYGAKNTIWYRENGYGNHDWAFCMLENFGANVGMHGRMDQLIDNYYTARETERFNRHLKGMGLTMEGSETNPVMYELMCELPWRKERIDKKKWLRGYVNARYGNLGAHADKVYAAWEILADGIYNCPNGNNQQGPSESVFCSRPSLECFQASSWSKMMNYYDPNSTMEAAKLMLEAVEESCNEECRMKNEESRLAKGNHSSLKNSEPADSSFFILHSSLDKSGECADSSFFILHSSFLYDLVDICRQAIADRGRIVYNQMVADFKSFDRKAFKRHKAEFLGLILKQDSLLATRSEFRVGRWLRQARSLGKTPEEKDLYEWNARVQITTWGNRYCADTGGLRDYAHKEWNGLLKDFYYPRWVHYLDILEQEIDGKLPVLPVGNSSWKKDDNPAMTIDWYALEEPWTLQHNTYPAEGNGNVLDVCRRILGPLTPQLSEAISLTAGK